MPFSSRLHWGLAKTSSFMCLGIVEKEVKGRPGSRMEGH